MHDPALQLEIETLYAQYAEALDDGPLEQWPEFFHETCLYLIMPRDNYERGLPLAVMRGESRNMLKDRVTAIRETLLYEPRYLRHHITNIRLQAAPDQALAAKANFSIVEVLPEALPRIAMIGRYIDLVSRDVDGVWRFDEKRCVYDSLLVANSLIFPV